MKKHFVSLLLLSSLCLFTTSLSAQTAPFSIELNDVTPSNNAWPGLHSFAFAEWDSLWVVVGGRTNGLHGFFLATGFPPASANDDIWVMNPRTGSTWTYDINLMADSMTEVLRTTNPQYAQDSNYLYIVGGYGKDIANGAFTTFPTLTAIDLSVLVPAIVNGSSPISAFEQISDSFFQVCGGELHELEDDFYLMGGNDFSGRYSDDPNPQFVQVYTDAIRRFNISHQGGLSFLNDTAFVDTANYHRRDMNLAPTIFPDGSEGLGAYGGVFRPDTNLPFVHPIYIGQNEILTDSSYAQKMSHYTCPIIPIFDARSQEMYTTFFGGISWNYYDHVNQQFVKDDLVPFIDDITTLVRHADSSSTEIVSSTQFDEFLGTNAIFIPNLAIPHYDNKVFKLDQISGRTLLGHIYGGIHAQIRNFTPSSANKRVFEVYITPSATLAIDPKLNNFSSRCQAGKAELYWSIPTESEMDYFEIAYSKSDQQSWEIVQKIDASSAQNYSWTDTRNRGTAISYRLKGVRLDGSHTYSQIIKSDCDPQTISLTIIPNPAEHEIGIRFPNSSDIHYPISLELTDIYGRLVHREELYADLRLAVGSLASGIYQVRLRTADGGIAQGRFLKI